MQFLLHLLNFFLEYLINKLGNTYYKIDNFITPNIDFNVCVCVEPMWHHEELKCLNKKTCVDPDEISAIFFTEFKLLLAIKLQLLFDKYSQTGIFPDK